MILIKVAIIGAGVSGLACALEFKKNGYTPVIFEKKSELGGCFTGIWLRMFTKHFCDPINYIKKTYSLDIQPLNRLNKIIMKFPNKQVYVSGNLGYIMNRTSDKGSLENQIAQQTNIEVSFNSDIKVEDIKNNFDYVIVASGTHTPAENLGLWTNTSIFHTKIAQVKSNFKPGVCTVWFNREYANHSFCYIIPKTSSVATLVQVLDGIPKDKHNLYWDKFLDMEELKYEILEIKDITHYSGFVYPMQVDNILFTGNAAGLTDDLIGIGAYNAVISGILAARSITHNLDYNAIMSPYRKDIIKIHEFRKALNTFDNHDFDMLASFIGAPIIKQMIYNNPFFKIRHAYPLARGYNWFRQYK
ncbi:MAG TPA: dehydrogenase [Clostridiales bacterium]|nr:dehydrogenase [Clostridiales bacterium]